MRRIAGWERALNDRDVNPDDLLPCHYFDYMWGTSTGGLIAIMLGRLRMSVEQALTVYRDVGNSIFGKKQRRALRGINFVATRYDHANVERAVKKITREYCREHEHGRCQADDKLEWSNMRDKGVENARDLCQAVVITARAGASGKHSQPLPLRTYHYEHHPTLPTRDPNMGVEDSDLRIWEAARATSAAPFYFKMYEKKDENGKLRRYKDGGTLLNNPAEKALNEVRDRRGLVQGVRKDPALLLSIGTGIRYDTPFANQQPEEFSRSRSADIPFFQSIRERLAIAKHILVRYTEGEIVHRIIKNQAGAEHLWYKRLNVDKGLGEMDLGDWRRGTWTDNSGQQIPHSGGSTLTQIETATRDYLKRTELHTEDDIEWFLLPSELLDHVAERLVRHRAERRKLVTAENEIQWQTYQGRYVSGRKAEPWDNDSHDLPKSPQGSVENLKDKAAKSV